MGRRSGVLDCDVRRTQATTETPAPPRTRIGVALVFLLGSLTAFPPLTIDLYLPALPQMTGDLHTNEPTLQLTLTACLIGLAVGQAILGPVSDSLGRRRPLLAGVAVYALASAACALAPNVGILVGARFVQAVAGAAGVVIARAIVRDLVAGAEIARVLSTLLLVTGLAPILAPFLGSQLIRITDWRGLFWVLTGIGAVLFAATARWLRETLPPERRRAGGLAQTGRAYAALAGDRTFMGYALASGLAFAALFAYISGSPFVYQDVFGLSPQLFGVLFGVNSLGLILLAQVNGRIVGRFGPRRMLFIGLSFGLAGGVLLILAATTMALGVPGVLVALFLSVASLGMVMPNATALGLSSHPDMAGTASAMMGTLQFGIGAVIGPLTTSAGVTSAVPMAVVIASCLAVAIATVLGLTGRRPRPS